MDAFGNADKYGFIIKICEKSVLEHQRHLRPNNIE